MKYYFIVQVKTKLGEYWFMKSQYTWKTFNEYRDCMKSFDDEDIVCYTKIKAEVKDGQRN